MARVRSMASMWVRRAIAVIALAIAALAVAIVSLRPDSSSPTASATATPTPTATATAKARKKPKTAVPPVGEITGARAKRMPVPILMYHVISKAPAGVANAELWVDKDVFADEM